MWPAGSAAGSLCSGLAEVKHGLTGRGSRFSVLWMVPARGYLHTGGREGTSTVGQRGRRQELPKLPELLFPMSLNGKGSPLGVVSGFAVSAGWAHLMEAEVGAEAGGGKGLQASSGLPASRLPCGSRLQMEGVAWK